MASISPRYRRFYLSPRTPAGSVRSVVAEFRRRPGILGATYEEDRHALLVYYDLGYICMAAIENLLHARGFCFLQERDCRVVRRASTRSEAAERRMLLGDLVDDIPCGSTDPDALQLLATWKDREHEEELAAAIAAG